MIQLYIHLIAIAVIVALIAVLQAMVTICAHVQVPMNFIPQLDFAVKI